MKIELKDFWRCFLPSESVASSVPSFLHHRLGDWSLARDQMSTTLL